MPCRCYLKSLCFLPNFALPCSSLRLVSSALSNLVWIDSKASLAFEIEEYIFPYMSTPNPYFILIFWKDRSNRGSRQISQNQDYGLQSNHN